jgi:predicted NAD/FAD-binding protein
LDYSEINSGNEKSKLFPVLKDKRRARQLLKKDFIRLTWFSNKLSRKAKKFMNNPDSSTSFKQFLNDINIPNDLINGFYIPLFARPWGIKIIDMPAAVILDWLNRLRILTPKPAQWYKNEGGVKKYIDHFAFKLTESGVKINTNSQISYIERFDEGGQY